MRERPPERIGPYRLLQKLGEGGMGEVYVAEQEQPVRRRVALKLIKRGHGHRARSSPASRSERQALALMNHPNIAKVFDAGATEQGRPYFAMEYVQGVPITEYCDRNRLDDSRSGWSCSCRSATACSTPTRRASSTATSSRRTSWSRIEDGKPVPKIIDFGVAKATSQRLTETTTVYTELGQLIGTPEYMSPEQAEMTGIDIDTRTDVYSLGVVLYELLVGALPFDPEELRTAGFDEMRRRIREEEPPRPSTRVIGPRRRSRDGGRARRRTDPSTLGATLRGDLDWITMKALEKDRDAALRVAARAGGGHRPAPAPTSRCWRARRAPSTGCGSSSAVTAWGSRPARRRGRAGGRRRRHLHRAGARATRGRTRAGVRVAGRRVRGSRAPQVRQITSTTPRFWIGDRADPERPARSTSGEARVLDGRRHGRPRYG